jgi:hypothetical protein
MWDRGFGGDAAETQSVRVSGEVSASVCHGAAPVTAADVRTGLVLREWLQPAVVDVSTLPALAAVLKSFHATKHPVINLEHIRDQVDQDWCGKSEEG